MTYFCRRAIGLSLLLLLSSDMIFGARPVLDNAAAIVAFGTRKAYVIAEGPVGGQAQLFEWSVGSNEWVRISNASLAIVQGDCFSDGSSLIGRDGNDRVAKCVSFPTGWTYTRDPKTYDWVLYDPATKETRGLLPGDNDLWESWDERTLEEGDAWYKYLPAGPDDIEKMSKVWFLDKDDQRFTRWERGDVGYYVTMNRRGGDPTAEPFYIYYYGDDENLLLDRTTYRSADGFNEFDPDDWEYDNVVIKQFSHDEENRNLWCIDERGIPWRWDNPTKDWIESKYIREEPDDLDLSFFNRKVTVVTAVVIEGDDPATVYAFGPGDGVTLVVGESTLLGGGCTSLRFVIYYDSLNNEPEHNFHHTLVNNNDFKERVIRKNFEGDTFVEDRRLEACLVQLGAFANGRMSAILPRSDDEIVRR